MPPSPQRAAAPGTEESEQLEHLNEGKLRALLDEALTYKTPKDREGKSSLFKNLLEEAEQDEFQFGRTSICGSSSSGASGKRGRVKRNLTHFPHSGSLQDLAVAGSCPDTRPLRPQVKHRRAVPVSARSLHGGSLPANVDQQNFGVTENQRSFFEDVRCGSKVGTGARMSGDYIATVRCINPQPLSEPNTSDFMVLRKSTSDSDHIPSPPVSSAQSTYTTGFCDDDDGTEMEQLRYQKIQHIPNYTTRATLEIGSPSMPGETAVDRNLIFNLVDTNHGCIPSPVISQPPPAPVLETKPLQLASTYQSVRSITGSSSLDCNSPINSSTSSVYPVSSNTQLLNPYNSTLDVDKKYEDIHNTNFFPGNLNNTTHTKKPKRKKFCKNETQILSEQIPGYKGDGMIHDIIKYIEADADNAKHHGKNQSKTSIEGKVTSNKDYKAKDDNDEKSGKKRSIERKTKDTKIKRANSMEELSRRKFEDLTINNAKDGLTLRKSKKSTGSDKADSSSGKPSERRSWCNDESESYFKQESRNIDADDASTGNLSNTTSSSAASKNKTGKQLQADVDVALLGCDPFHYMETSDFQTVTKKKKLRKRQSPSDEARNRPSNLYGHNMHGGKNSNGGRSVQERDTIYKRLGQGSRLSASSPPSDKSNDSNDDLDSVHSLPADASGERLQASYADMARAGPPASPPPPPAPVSRPHNFPDLIESCNYYANDVSLQDKHLDVSIENTKNLLQKDNNASEEKCKIIKANCPETEQNVQKPRDQYPNSETRQKMEGKALIKNKIENKYNNNNYKQNNQTCEKVCDKKIVTKIVTNKLPVNVEFNSEINSENMIEENCSPKNYVAFVKHNTVTNSSSAGEPFMNMNKFNHTINKIENLTSKPPDVVLPLTEMVQSINNRPPVIIMNEELNKSSDNLYNIDGITFGFDINEQLINGDITSVMDDCNVAVNAPVTNGIEADSVAIIYNSNIDFPPINDKPYRDYSEKSKNSNDDLKHSKKSNRISNKDGMKFVNKNCIAGIQNQKESSTNDVQKEDDTVQVVETRIGRDKSLRYLTPTTTSKDIYILDTIVNYVGMAWEDIIKSPGDNVRYFSEQQ